MYTYNQVPAAPNKPGSTYCGGTAGTRHPMWRAGCGHSLRHDELKELFVRHERPQLSLACQGVPQLRGADTLHSVTAAVRWVERVCLLRTQPSWTSLCAFNSRPEAAALVPWCSGTLPMAGWAGSGCCWTAASLLEQHRVCSLALS